MYNHKYHKKGHTMSKTKITKIITAVLVIPFLLITPTHAMEWDDGYVEGGYNYEDVYLGRSSALHSEQTTTMFNDSKSNFQDIPGVSIAEEPQDATVNWPEGATFQVEVNNPNDIPLHYQWAISDGSQVFEPAGATSNIITVPTTYYGMSDLYLCCIISDDNGNRMFSRDAKLTVNGAEVQPGESRPLLYIGEFLIEPGESFNLADHNYGSGTVSFDANGTDITLNNVQMNNPAPVFDWFLAQTQGILLMNTGYKVPEPWNYDESLYTDLPTEYHINFIGENSISSELFDDIGAGNIFQAYFSDSYNPNKPTVYLDGDGSLTLNGGSYNYISDANLNIGIDIEGNSNNLTHFGDAFGIQALDITVREGSTLNLNNRNASLRAYTLDVTSGSLYIEDGVEINATITAGIGGNKFTGNDLLSAEDYVVIGRANINLVGRTIPEWFTPIDEHQIHHFIGIGGGEGIAINNANINIDIDVPEHPDGQYTANIMGIKSGKSRPSQEKTLLSIDNTNLIINLNAPTSLIVSGLNVGDNSVISNSNIDITTSGLGSVNGISAGDNLEIKDSIINADVNSSGSYLDPEDGTIMDETYGILSKKLDIDLNDDSHQVSAKVNRGVAFTTITGDTYLEPDDEHPSFTPDYTPTNFILKNKAKIITPSDGMISGYTYTTNWGRLDYAAEAIYSTTNTSAPALEAVIKASNPEPTPAPEDDTDDSLPVPNTGANTTTNSIVAVGIGIISGIISLITITLLNKIYRLSVE